MAAHDFVKPQQTSRLSIKIILHQQTAVYTSNKNIFKTTVYSAQSDQSHNMTERSHRTPRHTSERSSSEPLAEVQRALLVVLVLHAPHPEAGGLLGLRKLREHYMSSWDNPILLSRSAPSLTSRRREPHSNTPLPAARRPPHTRRRRRCDDDVAADEGARHKGAQCSV